MYIPMINLCILL